MLKAIAIASLGVVMGYSSVASACGGYGELPAVVRCQSVSPEMSTKAIAELRGMGPAGLAQLLKEHEARLKAGVAPAALAPLRAAIDQVAAQKDAHASGLYWYTDFEKAKEVARKEGKAILSLRLLGKLDEEYSCANSRFFRTTLYANAEVSKYLRENYVLHWKSVRPVPRITIDMGDGRKIERTITGNSIHYVMDAEGRVVDAVPGLYGARMFLDAVREAGIVAKASADGTKDRVGMVKLYRQGMMQNIQERWLDNLTRVGSAPGQAATKSRLARTLQIRGGAPSASEAAPVARGKSAAEVPMLRQIMPDRGELVKASTEEVWQAIAALHFDDAKLDEASRKLIAEKNPIDAVEAARITVSKVKVEDPMLRMIRSFQRSIAEDTVRNEYLLRSQILAWLEKDGMYENVEPLNEKVYAELFLTPSSDPWLGLVPKDAFTALPKNGLVEERVVRN